MLKESKFNRLPCSQFVNRCISLSAFIACTWIGCWSVSGQNITQENQTDSKVVAASHTAPVTMFSQPATAPWEVLGNQPGYFKIDVGRIINHPYANFLYRPMITEALNSAFKSEKSKLPSLKQFGFSLDEIDQLQGGIWFCFRFNLDPPTENPYSLQVASPQMEVTTRNPVDWPSLIKVLDFEKMYGSASFESIHGSEFDLDEVRDTWLDSAEKSCEYKFNLSTLFSTSPSMVSSPPTETKKAVWEAVSGGAATIIYDINQSGEVPEGYQEEDSVTDANNEMTNATETAAWGVDLSEDYTTIQVRFAAVPKDGVSTDELVNKYEALKAEVANHTADEDIAQIFLRQFVNAKVSSVQSERRNGTKTKAYLFVEGECTIDFAEIFKNKKSKY